MSRVLLAVSPEWQSRLVESVLWRSGVARYAAANAEAVLDMSRSIKPQMVVLDDGDPAAEEVVRRLRADPQTRQLSIAILARAPSTERQEMLCHAGANAVLSEADGQALWDDRFEDLLGVPPRREVRVPIAITIWSRRDPRPGAEVVGVSVNVSVTGLLVETRAPLAVGSTLNMSFRLPTAAEELRLMGRVVWTTQGPGEAWRSGVEFLGFHGRTMEVILSFAQQQPQ